MLIIVRNSGRFRVAEGLPKEVNFDGHDFANSILAQIVEAKSRIVSLSLERLIMHTDNHYPQITNIVFEFSS
jgi:hypothetical protein